MINLYRILMLLTLLAACAAIGLSITLVTTELTFLAVLPFGYLVVTPLLLRITWATGPSIFLMICQPTMFLRYVAFPVLAAINGGYEGRSWSTPSIDSYEMAIILMTYELVVGALLIAFLERRYHRASRNRIVALRALPLWYITFIFIIGFLLVAIFPQALLLINIVKPLVIVDDLNIPAFATLAAMILVIAKVFLILILTYRLSKVTRWPKIALWVAALLGAINIAIFFGTNRMAMVLTALSTVLIFYRFFGVRAKIPIGLIVIITIGLFSLITTERAYVQKSDSLLVNIADNIQAYTGGIYNVAIGVEVPQSYPEAKNFSVLIYDFLRPTIGLNIIVQNWDILYSNIYFNYRMFTHVDRRSQIMPMIAQSNLFFSVFFAPVLSLLFIWLGYKFQNHISGARYIEIQFCLILVVMRLGFFWGQNTMNMMSYISLYLILPFFLISAYLFLDRSLRLYRNFV